MIFSSFIGSGLIVFFLFEYFNIFPFFFFSSRRRHTSFDCDGSSDVCSSDLGLLEIPVDLEEAAMVDGDTRFTAFRRKIGRASCREKSVDLGGRRIIKKK